MFVPFKILDAIDIIIVAFFIYQLYILVRGTVAIKILLGILSLYLLWYVVKVLDMTMLGTILGQFIAGGVIALIIVFQQELRRFLLMIGSRGILGNRKIINRLFKAKWNARDEIPLNINGVVKACIRMSASKTGALIVIAKTSALKFYVDSGDRIDARVSSVLIESIFFNNSPLHDGAIIIGNNTIKSARCILPVADDEDFPSHLGFRHRASVGITQNTDAIAIAVSEETGKISYSKNGMLFTDVPHKRLQSVLEKEYFSTDSDID